MCQLRRISRSGFYAWVKQPLPNHAIEKQRLLRLIRHSYAASYGVYGSLRIFLVLKEMGETCSEDWVA